MRGDTLDRVRWLKLYQIVGFVVMASAVSAVTASAAPTTVTFSALRPTLRIDAGKPDGVAEIIIEATITQGDQELPKTPLMVTDDGPQVPSSAPPPSQTQTTQTTQTTPPPPTVIFNDAIEIPLGDAKRRLWRVRASLTNFPTAGTTMPRKMKIAWGSCTTPAPLPYWASNATVPAMTWKVTGLPSEWSASGSWCIPLRIAVTGQRATGILLTSTLIEQSTKQPMASRLYLAVDGHRADGAALEIAINDTQKQIALCADASDASPGKYQGVLNLSAAEKPEGDPVTITLSTVTGGAIVVGIVVLLLGCGLAYVLRVLAPARLLRNQALLPAALIRERAEALTNALTKAMTGQPPNTIRHVPGALAKLVTDLDDKTLENQGLVPRNTPSPFGATVDAPKYKTLLDASSALLARLDVIVNEGMLPAITRNGANLTAELQALDGFAIIDPPPSLPDLQKRIADVLITPAARAAGAAAPPPTPVTAETLSFQIEHTSSLLWIGSVLLTFTIGLFVLILNNPAFGVPMDFLTCFLWGFGIPAVAGQLTPTTGTTALGVSLPKTTP